MPQLRRYLPFTLLLIPILYLLTLAQGLVLGDPTEYTMIAHILGIAHPPGYAFITVLGKLFQTLIPFGDIPWRMHLLSAVGGTFAAACLYGIVKTIGTQGNSEGSEQSAVSSDQSAVSSEQSPVTSHQSPGLSVSQSLSLQPPSLSVSQSLNLPLLSALFTAFTLAFSANWWQHAIHANPHIWTGVFLAFNLYCLTKWDAATRRQGDTGTRRRGDAARNGSSVAPSPPRTSGSSFSPSPPDWG